LHDYQPGRILSRASKITHTDARLSLQQTRPQFAHFSGSSKGVIMARQVVFTSKAAKPSPTYSQAVKAAGLVFVSGTAPIEPETGKIKGTSVQEQTQQCLTNIAAILEAAGTSMEKIASATGILADEDDFAGMNEEWMRWFPTNPPALQGAKRLARIPGLKISITVIAEA
jgi:2-iminobutanoate/2-iminopropanoate deaminase